MLLSTLQRDRTKCVQSHRFLAPLLANVVRNDSNIPTHASEIERSAKSASNLQATVPANIMAENGSGPKLDPNVGRQGRSRDAFQTPPRAPDALTGAKAPDRKITS